MAGGAPAGVEVNVGRKTTFRVDDPEIDTEALEERVHAAIERKRGVRFSDEELEELRAAPLRPRLRREDLPRGWLEQMHRVRGPLPEVSPAPGPVGASASEIERGAWQESIERVDTGDETPVGATTEPIVPAEELYVTGNRGLRGVLVGLLRRVMKPFYRATLNLDWVLTRMGAEVDAVRDEGRARDDLVNRRLEQAFDLLKDRLDQRIDATGDWVGTHLTEMSGELERGRERELHLLHNLVLEVTDLRLGLDRLEDRLEDLARRLEGQAARGRALEELTLEREE